MSKCIKLYKIEKEELAKSENGEWYCREYGWNGYGYGFSKWQYLGKLIKIERIKRTYENLNGNVINERRIHLSFRPSKSIVDFYISKNNKLYASGYNYRLPNE